MMLRTDRLLIRHPVEADRRRFVELFTSESFMVFGGCLDVQSANARFDHMVDMVGLVPYAKQPVVDRASGTIVGYTGVDSVNFEGMHRLEWGWRLVEGARGSGVATEAVTALLSFADTVDTGEMLCLIDPANVASRRVADRVGFSWWKRVDWDDDPNAPTDALVRPIGVGGPPLQAPRPV